MNGAYNLREMRVLKELLIDEIIQSSGNPRDHFIENEYTDNNNRKY